MLRKWPNKLPWQVINHFPKIVEKFLHPFEGCIFLINPLIFLMGMLLNNHRCIRTIDFQYHSSIFVLESNGITTVQFIRKSSEKCEFVRGNLQDNKSSIGVVAVTVVSLTAHYPLF